MIQTDVRSMNMDASEHTELVLQVLVESKGNLKLAQDCLHHNYNLNISTYDLVDLLKDHMGELKAKMEVVATLELFSLMPQLHKTLVENLSSLEGGEAVTAYMKLMDLITKATSANEINININEQKWRLVPRELQRAYAQLEASGQLQQIIEHDIDDEVA